MVSVHIGPYPREPDGIVEFAYGLPYGKASILFVTLAGIGVSLLAGGRGQRVTARLLVRCAVLFPLGIALQELPVDVAVILQYYALYFLIALAALRLPDGWLLGCSLALAALGPVVLLAATLAEPGWFVRGGQVTLAEPVRLARALVLTGYYPAITWSAPLLFGMWLGRRDLAATAVAKRLLAGGVLGAMAAFGASALLTRSLDAPAEPVAWAYLAVAEGHSEMPLWLVSATAVACALLGALLLLARAVPRVVWPLAATGQLALTIYVGHLFVLAAVPEVLLRDAAGPAALSLLRFALVVIAAATLWRAFFARGPIEALLNRP